MQAAISEKDATIALLEMTSTKKQRNLEEIERLTHEKHRLQTSLREVVSLSRCAVTCGKFVKVCCHLGKLCSVQQYCHPGKLCCVQQYCQLWKLCRVQQYCHLGKLYSSTVTWGSCTAVLSPGEVVQSTAVLSPGEVIQQYCHL